jgi:hypothetical protein
MPMEERELGISHVHHITAFSRMDGLFEISNKSQIGPVPQWNPFKSRVSPSLHMFRLVAD